MTSGKVERRFPQLDTREEHKRVQQVEIHHSTRLEAIAVRLEATVLKQIVIGGSDLDGLIMSGISETLRAPGSASAPGPPVRPHAGLDNGGVI